MKSLFFSLLLGFLTSCFVLVGQRFDLMEQHLLELKREISKLQRKECPELSLSLQRLPDGDFEVINEEGK